MCLLLRSKIFVAFSKGTSAIFMLQFGFFPSGDDDGFEIYTISDFGGSVLLRTISIRNKTSRCHILEDHRLKLCWTVLASVSSDTNAVLCFYLCIHVFAENIRDIRI
jgi:hypothetical protein